MRENIPSTKAAVESGFLNGAGSSLLELSAPVIHRVAHSFEELTAVKDMVRNGCCAAGNLLRPLRLLASAMATV